MGVSLCTSSEQVTTKTASLLLTEANAFPKFRAASALSANSPPSKLILRVP